VGVIFHLPFHEGLFGGAKERLRGGGARWRSSYREKKKRVKKRVGPLQREGGERVAPLQVDSPPTGG
jgi:hypothetical protein